LTTDSRAAFPDAVAPSVVRCRRDGFPRRPLDVESQAWWKRLHTTGPVRSAAIAELHERLCQEAEFYVRRHARGLASFPRSDINDLATQAADDALVVLLRKLDDYRGESQFWTWARRFAQLEAPACIRRRLGGDRVGVAGDPDQLALVADPGRSTQDLVEIRELLQAVSHTLAQLSLRQQTVLVAIAINGVPTATLARELACTPGAIYKSLHDARSKLKLHLASLDSTPTPAACEDHARGLVRDCPETTLDTCGLA
jgi:RNA polymerase sigma-70 factor (ECF subfamily)